MPRQAPLELPPEDFRALGHKLVDDIADFLRSLPARRVTPGHRPPEVRGLLKDGLLPEQGEDAARLLDRTAHLLFDNSLFNGHPRFWGYITSSAAPIGALADLLAAAVNPNLGGWELSPIATEIERQTIRWIAELLGYPTDCGGLLVSGGNMANFVGFLAARRALAGEDVRTQGTSGRKLRIYTSQETHTWVQKAADMFGVGTAAIRWVPVDRQLRMAASALRIAIMEDLEQGNQPAILIGTAGSVSTGAIDPLPELYAISREYGMWFHVDGAYGALAAALPSAPADLKALALADSVAVDPHKWLYSPIEAGCALVRDPEILRSAFSYRPPYYHFHETGEEAPINYYEYGPQNTRGFRALKVWLALRQAGREGYVQMISDDIRLAQELYRLAQQHPELEACTHDLSITTFRYVPPDVRPGLDESEDYLNDLNTRLLERLQRGGEAFVSNAVIEGKYLLRACIVNFRTSQEDIEALPEIAVRLGRELHGSRQM